MKVLTLGKATSVALLLGLAAVLLSAAPAYAPPSTYTGGADVYPQSMLNDHTVYRIHFTATGGLMPNTVYNVNPRLSSAVGAGNYRDARGFTWSPALQQWVQNRADAIYFPTVTSDATGAASGTVFFKVGDENFTGFPASATHADGQAHLTVTLQAGVGATASPTDGPVVTILDARTQGAHVHNYKLTGAAAGSDVSASASPGGDVMATQSTETNGVDDDDNGVTDDEQYGTTGVTGDFLLGVPAGSTFDVLLGGAVWASSVVAGPADTDVAIGAKDRRPPTAPRTLTATAGTEKVRLTWKASHDAGGSRVAAYSIFRMVGSQYRVSALSPDPSLTTAVPELIGRVPVRSGGQHGHHGHHARHLAHFVDTTAREGITYIYVVRAVDGATNAGPGSNDVTVTPK